MAETKVMRKNKRIGSLVRRMIENIDKLILCIARQIYVLEALRRQVSRVGSLREKLVQWKMRWFKLM